MNVLEATLKRLEIIFSDFDHIYFSVSGGKDSSTMVQLANQVAQKMNKKFDVMFLDQEAISKFTVSHIEELKHLSQIRHFFHICLPFEEDNACSFFEPQWIMWDQNKKDIWTREMPQNCINEFNHEFTWFRKGMADFEFYALFSDWYQQKFAMNQKIACCVGIRAKESLDRRISINNRYNETYQGYRWSIHQAESVNGNDQIYRFFPMFDWDVKDIWKCNSVMNFSYNKIYDLMYKCGWSIHEMRICQPFGVQQRIGLDLFAKTEPETWEKIVNRVSGANCGAIYSRSKLFGHLKTNKPKHMSWEQYCCFIVESISLRNKDIALWYLDKIEVTLKYHKTKYNQEITDQTVSNSKEFISWQIIARALEKNDFWMKRLSFGESKKGYQLLDKLKLKEDLKNVSSASLPKHV